MLTEIDERIIAERYIVWEPKKVSTVAQPLPDCLNPKSRWQQLERAYKEAIGNDMALHSIHFGSIFKCKSCCWIN